MLKDYQKKIKKKKNLSKNCQKLPLNPKKLTQYILLVAPHDGREHIGSSNQWGSVVAINKKDSWGVKTAR